MASPSNPTGWFDLGRFTPFPAIYSENKTPVTVDVLEAGWVAAFFTLFVPFCFILPAFTGFRAKIMVFVRVVFFLLLGLAIMLCNFGQEWEVGHLKTKTAYRAGTAQEIQAEVGVKLGLRSVNITLKALEEPAGDLQGEKINYNERFYWTWVQGRAGFGPFAGQIQRDFRAAQHRGAPLPILWVAEYFTFDGEGFRFGRHYRLAGWYAHMCVWFALPLWLLTLILAKIVIIYAAKTMILMGLSLISAAVIWATHRNFNEFQVPFEDGILITKFGVYWYLCLVSGLVSFIFGIIFHILADKFHNEMSAFFGNNPLEYLEEEIGEEEVKPPTSENEVEMSRLNTQPTLKYRARARGTSHRHWKEQPVLVKPQRPWLTQQQPRADNLRQRNIPDGGAAADGVRNPGYVSQDYDDLQNLNYQQGYQATQGYPANQGYQGGYQADQGYQGGYQEGYQADQGYQGGYQEEEEPLYGNVLTNQPPHAPPRPPKPGQY